MSQSAKKATITSVFMKGHPDIVETKGIWTMSARKAAENILDPIAVFGFSDPQPEGETIDRVIKLVNEFFPSKKGMAAGDYLRTQLNARFAVDGKQSDEPFFVKVDSASGEPTTVLIAVHIPTPGLYTAEVGIAQGVACGFMGLEFVRHLSMIDLENGKTPPKSVEEIDGMLAGLSQMLEEEEENVHAEEVSAYRFRNNDFKLIEVYGPDLPKRSVWKGWDQYMESFGFDAKDAMVIARHQTPVSFDRIIERLASCFTQYFPRHLLGHDLTHPTMVALRKLHKNNQGQDATLHYRGTLKGLPTPMSFHIAIAIDKDTGRYTAELAAGMGRGAKEMQQRLLKYANDDKLPTDPVVTAEMLDGIVFH